MEIAPQSQPSGNDIPWITSARLRDREQARRDLDTIWKCGATSDLLHILNEKLAVELVQLDDADAAIANLSRFIAASRSPTALLALFERDSGSLPALLQVFSTSQSLANRLIADPESFDLLRASDGQPAARRYLVDEIRAELEHLDRHSRAALAIRKFTQREVLRIAYGEFVRGISPDKVGRQLAYLSDAVIEAALHFCRDRLSQRMALPQRSDGRTPEVTVIGFGNLGGEEMSYGSPLKLAFFYDSIDQKNTTHLEFYETLVRDVCSLLRPEDPKSIGWDVDLRENPKFSDDVSICSVEDAVHALESAGQTWQRLNFVKARVVAGSVALGESMLRSLAKWIYRRYLNRADIADIRTLRHKLERRAEQSDVSGDDVVNDPGGRSDVELTIQFLQLLHGGELTDVRQSNTTDAMFALERAGCITKQEAILLAGNYARLCRLEHQLSMMSDLRSSCLPSDPDLRRRIAWRLGIRTMDGSDGDLEKFIRQLRETFDVNRKIINHLMIDAPHESDSVPEETELMLDPEPDPQQVQSILARHGYSDCQRAMEDLVALSTEATPYLSPRRCRHFFALIAPTLLVELARTPNPHATLTTLVRVTDSIGAKSILWELFGSNRPTMQLMVQLCAATPYLTGILTRNPGMIDELVDSLLTNRLPSAMRLDAQSIELSRGAEDIEPILHSFKNAAHLTIGVRDMLGKETVESTHRALSDTAEACVRRLIDHEQESLAEKYGDPAAKANGDEEGEAAELVALALGKFGGREPNYHSDLDVVFLYSADGETQRRLGGRRTTTTNHHFFNQLAQQVITRVNHVGPNGRLYELDSRLRMTGEEGLLAISIDDFFKRFRQGTASLWQRISLCKARAISGSRRIRQRVDTAIVDCIVSTQWRSEMAKEIRTLRHRMQQSTNPGNLKRGEGGTVDVELVAQILTLKHARESAEIIVPGTTASLAALAKAGFLGEEESIILTTNYRTLRWVEANLRLLNTPERHELPEDEETMRHLAFLLSESDPTLIVAQCRQACQSNRRIFDSVFDRLANE